MQNDCLKEFIAQHAWLVPPRPAMRIVTDMIEFCAREVPRWNTVSASAATTSARPGRRRRRSSRSRSPTASPTSQSCVERGLDVDDFAPRLSFFFDVHNDFFEEIAKFRAARRIWARLMKERFGAKKAESMKLRTHAQTAGVSLTAQQPYNNVVRVALQALAAVLGGTQSLHTNSLDETYALPTEDAVTIALRTQQIIAEESGVASTIDPLGGAYFVEDLTNRLEARGARRTSAASTRWAAWSRAIEKGYPQREIAASAYRFQRQLEAGERVMVGVNKYEQRRRGREHPAPARSTRRCRSTQIENLQRGEGDARRGAA